MRQIVSAACGLLLCLGGTIQAQTSSDGSAPGSGPAGSGRGESVPGVVVELFTSQGCSACPPADAFFAELARDPGVIPLSLHVDYWDYIGWEDSFGDARFTVRQKTYARAIGSRTIYTPQMIVDGLDRVEGNRAEVVERLVRERSGLPSPVRLWLSRQGDKIAIRAEAVAAPGSPLRVELVRYRPTQTVGIERGENAGLVVTYANVVSDWQSLGEWSGIGVLSLSAPAPGSDPVVVLLQRPGPGEIVAAARLLTDRAGNLGGQGDGARGLDAGLAAAEAVPAGGFDDGGFARGGVSLGSKSPSATADSADGARSPRP